MMFWFIPVLFFACVVRGATRVGTSRLPLWARATTTTSTPGTTSTGTSNHTETITTSNNGSAILALASNRLSYYTVIRIGAVNLRVSVDTASSDLWVLSSDCASEACHGLPKYPINYQSSTFASVNDNSTAFSISYADGTIASGYVGMENVTVAGISLNQQAFGIVTNSNVSFVDLTSGVLGLGFPRISNIASTATQGTPFLSQLAETGRLAYPLFGLSAAQGGDGSISLGAVDASVVKNLSQIVWNDVVEFPPISSQANSSSYLHWAIPLTSISVNGTTITPQNTYGTTSSKSSLALFDIGASGIYGPHQDVERIFEAISGARRVNDGQWAVPCDYTGTLSFFFGEEEYVLQPTDYFIGPAQGNPNLCLSYPIATQPSADGIDWQLGAPFLRKVYSVYSYGINRKEPPKIGLYRLNTTTTTSPETEEQISSFFSSISATVPTTLPNQVLSSETYNTPSYLFNTAVAAPTGGIVSSALATNTYKAILESGNGQKYNASAIPTISPIPTVATIVLTDAAGAVTTSTSTMVIASVTLGLPEGSNSAWREEGRLWLLIVLTSVFVFAFT